MKKTIEFKNKENTCYIGLNVFTSEKKDEYKKYISEIIGNSKNILMVDTGYQGTTQYNIEKTYGLKFKGRYITYKGNPLLDDVKGFYDFETHKLKDNIIFLESVLKAL